MAMFPRMERPQSLVLELPRTRSHAERLRRRFLRDHISSLNGALAQLDGVLLEHRTHPVATLLGEIRAAMRDDREHLALLARALRTRPPVLKSTASRVAGRVGRLPGPIGRRKSSPLGRVAQLEALLMATVQRAAMWRILAQQALLEPRLWVVDHHGRAELAERQARLLERELVRTSAF